MTDRTNAWAVLEATKSQPDAEVVALLARMAQGLPEYHRYQAAVRNGDDAAIKDAGKALTQQMLEAMPVSDVLNHITEITETNPKSLTR